MTTFLTADQSVLSGYRPYHGSMLINGEFRDSVGGKRVDRIGPAHGIVAGTYADGSAEDALLAISAARRAFDSGIWASFTAKERAELLLKIADGIAQRSEEMAIIECLETGKPLAQARGEVSGCVDLWRYAASLARTLHGESYNTLGDQMLGLVLRQPAGVVSMITPWNFPIWILSQKLPFALAAGCTVVIKPSEFTSGTTLMLGEILTDAGVPAGVVNIVTGLGTNVGSPLVDHDDVDMVSFTGSTRVGRHIAAEAGRKLKKVSLELGGKNPQIIFPDCDFDAAVDAVVFGVYFNAGECCNSGSRVLVHQDIAEKFTRAVVEKARQVKVGDPLHPEVKVGSIINDNQMAVIEDAIRSAREDGAEILLGGERVTGGQGLFMAPTVVGGVKAEMQIAQEEVFGPVLAILTFADYQEAINIANNTLYGLSAAVWSKDIDICLEAARKINAGTVWVNTFLDGTPELPFGGFKQSGLGRELGKSAVEDYTEQKTVQLHIGARTNWWINNAN